MNQEAYSTIMSRRRVISLFGAAAGAGVAVAATLRSASAQTSGMERRDDRRDERENRRDQRRGTTDKPLNPTGSNPTGADPIAAEAVADLNALATTAAGKRRIMAHRLGLLSP